MKRTIEHLFATSQFDTPAPAQADGPFSVALSTDATPLSLETVTRDHAEILAQAIAVDGTVFDAGARISIAYSAVSSNGMAGFSLCIDGTPVGFFTLSPMIAGHAHLFDPACPLPVDQTPSNLSYFHADTMIKTTRGQIAISQVQIGDKVITRDHGLQTVRWTGHRLLPGIGALAPILINTGVLGCDADLTVAPFHRILIAGAMSELYLGTDETLVFANLLVNSKTVRRAPADFVPYVHIMFDQHEVIWGNGCLSESFFVGENTLSAFASVQRDKIKDSIKTDPARTTLARSQCHPHEGRVIAAALL